MSGPDHTEMDEGARAYRGVLLLLVALAAAGTVAAAAAAILVRNPVALHAAVTLGLSTGLLCGVHLAHAHRQQDGASPRGPASASNPSPTTADDDAGHPARTDAVPPAATEPAAPRRSWPARALKALKPPIERPQLGDNLQLWLFTLLIVATVLSFGAFRSDMPAAGPGAMPWIAAGVFLAGAVLSATAVRYLTPIPMAHLPEAAPLARGARVVTWVLIAAAIAIVLQALQLLPSWSRPMTLAVAALNVALGIGILDPWRRTIADSSYFDLDFTVTRLFGSEWNALTSVLERSREQLGIDLRSTWALAVVRQSLEPLAAGLVLLAWLSTSLTVLDAGEAGIRERFGIAQRGAPLAAGLHVHLPWPIDRVIRVPMTRVQSIAIGHEAAAGDEQEDERGPENVLWARQHAGTEYTLLLGNGRDLITIDAAVQFRLKDAQAWIYGSQNPIDALRAVAYRAVMRNTVNKTLSDALSENLVITTGRMRAMVQEDADALGLGVEILGFTVGGMHPPVMVALDYQSVVSAELGKVTAIVGAQAARNLTVPMAQIDAAMSLNLARAQGLEAEAKAAGEAASFKVLEAQRAAAPADYGFRRRLEGLESALSGRRFTIVDSRLQRDGGELWIRP